MSSQRGDAARGVFEIRYEIRHGAGHGDAETCLWSCPKSRGKVHVTDNRGSCPRISSPVQTRDARTPESGPDYAAATRS